METLALTTSWVVLLGSLYLVGLTCRAAWKRQRVTVGTDGTAGDVAEGVALRVPPPSQLLGGPVVTHSAHRGPSL